MSTTNPLSRIAHQLTLRRAELLGHFGSFIAVSLTMLVVGTRWKLEGNPGARWIMGHIDVAWWGVLATFSVAAGFGLSRFAAGRDGSWPSWVVTLIAWAFAGVLLADGILNAVYFAQNPMPWYMLEHASVYYARITLVGLLAVGLAFRPTFRTVPNGYQRLRLARASRVFVALLVITSTIAGVAVVGSQPFGDEQYSTATAAQGDELWSSSTGGAILGSPTIANGTVYAGAYDGTFYAFDAETGAEKWSASTGNTIRSSATVSNGTVYVGSNDNSLYAFDAETGDEKWNASTGGQIYSSPTVKNGTVYVGSHDDSLYAFDAKTGTQEWSFSTGGNVRSSPTVVDGTVYVGSLDNSLYAVDADTGNKEWNVSTGDSIYSSPTVENGTVYVGSQDNSLYAFDVDTGNQEWSASTGGNVRSSPTVKNGTVYVGSNDNSLYAFDAGTGNQEWSASTGDSVISSPTVSNGTVYVGSYDNSLYAFDADTGNQKWSSATGDRIISPPTVSNGTVYVGSYDQALYAFDTDHSKDSSGSRNRHHTLGHVGPVEQTSGSAATGSLVNGTVTNQAGDPCVNCTVVGWGVDYSNISAGKAQSLEDRARELVQEASNPKPPSWNPEKQLTGSNGQFQTAETEYVAVHSTADWGLGPARVSLGDTEIAGQSVELSEPMLQAPADKPVVVSVWDPTQEESGLIDTEDTANGDLHGKTVTDTAVVIKGLGPGGSAVSKTVVNTSTTVTPGGDFSFAAEHQIGYVNLPAGFYQVHPKGSPESSYTLVVGNPNQIAQSIASDLNTTAGKLSNRAQSIRDKVDTGKLTTYRTTTNANGSYSFSTGSNVKTVAIQAYKTPPGIAKSPENVTLEDIRTYYATTDYNGSVVLPSNVETVDAPSSNNTVRVREYSAPNYPDLNRFRNATEQFQQFLKNLSYSELPEQFQQPSVNVSRQQWKASYDTLRGLVEGRPSVEERAQELLGSDEELFINSSEATTAELRQRATVMRQAFVETPNTVAAGDTATSTTTDTISARFPFETDLEPEDVMVTVQYPNGTSEVLNTSSEYVSVESNIGADAVVIDEFPTSSDGPGSVSFNVKVANEDGIASARERVDNPAVSGSSPTLASISLSTLRPGPDETVSLQLNGGDETTITNVTQATVYGPDGSKLDTTTSKRGMEFKTAGQGIHTMQVTFQTTDGKTATVTERITAGTNPKAMPGGVRVSESPLGVYAVTGDGIDAGEVSIENGGSSVTVLAQLNETADIPTTLHVYTSGLSLPPESDLTVRVVQGAEQQSISKNVIVSVHLAQLPTDTATIYANGEPLPRDGGNANGEVSTSASGTTVETLTDANGVLELSTNAAPGRLASLVYTIELETGVNIPGLVILPALPTGFPGWAPPATAGLLVVAVPLAARRSSR